MFDARAVDLESDGKTGIIDVARLPPGDYQLFDFYLALVGGRTKRFRAKRDFSLPFTIRPRTGTYIGEFLAVGIKGSDGLSAGAFFVVSNMADRDIPIAKRKDPALRAVANTVADVRSLGTPLLQAGIRREGERGLRRWDLSVVLCVANESH